MLSAWQGWVPGRGGCLAGEGARWDHAASTCILRWPGNLPTLHCIYGLQIAWEGSLGTCRAGATVGIFDRCGMTSMNQATTLAGKQGSWDGMVHKGQSGGHVWVMPKHLPTWESRARLGHITVLVHVKTGLAGPGWSTRLCLIHVGAGLGYIRLGPNTHWHVMLIFFSWLTHIHISHTYSRIRLPIYLCILFIIII